MLYCPCRRGPILFRSRRVLSHLKRNFSGVPALLKPGGFLFSQRTPKPRKAIQPYKTEANIESGRYASFFVLISTQTFLTYDLSFFIPSEKQKIRPTGTHEVPRHGPLASLRKNFHPDKTLFLPNPLQSERKSVILSARRRSSGCVR